MSCRLDYVRYGWWKLIDFLVFLGETCDMSVISALQLAAMSESDRQTVRSVSRYEYISNWKIMKLCADISQTCNWLIK